MKLLRSERTSCWLHFLNLKPHDFMRFFCKSFTALALQYKIVPKIGGVTREYSSIQRQEGGEIRTIDV